MGQCFCLKSDELSTFTTNRIHLPIRLGGLGVRKLSHVRFAEFIDGIPPLLPQHHDDGELHGKLNELYVEHWIGENCLMSERPNMVRGTKSSLAMKALSLSLIHI